MSSGAASFNNMMPAILAIWHGQQEYVIITEQTLEFLNTSRIHKWERSKKLVIVKDETEMYIVSSFQDLLKNNARDSKLVSVENVDSNSIEEDDSSIKHNHYPDVSNNDKIDYIFNVLVKLKSQLEIVTADYQFI